ncbi:MAG: hypothetical protein IJ779_09540 [Ruminococcus sp.]|nr:hypothetical protein [Ruminococcus sp.]
MSKKNMFDLLENSGEGELEMIDRLTPELSDEQFERILEMCKRKRNILRKAKESNNIKMSRNADYSGEVTGVEEYKRPVWTKAFAVAASLVLLCGGLALGHNLLKRNGGGDTPVVVPKVAATTVTVTTVTTDSESADITTVTADLNAEATGTAVLGSETSSETSTAQSTASVQASSQVQAVTTIAENAADEPVATENPAYRAEAESFMKEYYALDDKRIRLFSVITDYLDWDDTFEAVCELVYLDNGMNEEEKPREDITVTFVHYTNPEFPSVQDMIDTCRNGMHPYLSDSYAERYFGMKVVPGQVIEDVVYNKYDVFPMYTEYNGKIYQCVSMRETSDNYMVSADDVKIHRTGWYVRNCKADSFELVEMRMYDNVSSVSGTIYTKTANGWEATGDFTEELNAYEQEHPNSIALEYEKYCCE